MPFAGTDNIDPLISPLVKKTGGRAFVAVAETHWRRTRAFAVD